MNWDHWESLSVAFAQTDGFMSDLSNWSVGRVMDFGFAFAFTTQFTSDLSRWVSDWTGRMDFVVHNGVRIPEAF